MKMTSESKQRNWNKSRDFSMGHIQIWHHFTLITKHWNILMTFISGIFQFYCKSEHKQAKWNKTKWEMCKSDKIFPYLQSITAFEWLLKFISSSWDWSQKIKNNNSRGKISICEFYPKNIKGNWAYLAEKNSKITTIFILSQKYFTCITIKTF